MSAEDRVVSALSGRNSLKLLTRRPRPYSDSAAISLVFDLFCSYPRSGSSSTLGFGSGANLRTPGSPATGMRLIGPRGQDLPRDSQRRGIAPREAIVIRLYAEDLALSRE